MLPCEETDDFNGPAGIEKVIAVLTAGHLHSKGGYPYDWAIRDGRVFIASLSDDGETELDIYRLEDMKDWEKRAHELYEKDPDEGWYFAVHETQDG
jgi:hypothetical protein